jgi:integrase
MTITPLPNGRYRVRVDVGGRGANRRRVNHTVETETDAIDLQDRLRRRPADGHRRTVLEAVDRYLDVYGARKAPNTYNGYRSVRDTYIVGTWLGALELDRIDADDLERFYTQVLDGTWRAGERPRATATVRNVHSVLSGAFSKAVRPAKWMSANPCRDIDLRDLGGPPARTSAADDYNLADLARVLDVAARPRPAGKGTDPKPYDHRAFVRELEDLTHVALATGAREGELAGLRWSDVDLLAGAVAFHGSITRKQRGSAGPTWLRKSTKTGKPRAFAISESARAALEDRYRRHAAQATAAGVDADTLHGRAVFSRELEVGFTSPAALGARWRRAAAAAGVTLTLHDLRHLNASEMQHGGVSVAAATARTGHASKRMFLDTYGHHRVDVDDPAVPVLEHTWQVVQAARKNP